MRRAVMWFRRDLRLADNPALLAAQRAADEVLPVFVLDPALERQPSHPRMAFLLGCLHELSAATGGALVVRRGEPGAVVAGLVDEVGAGTVFVTGDAGPYGRARDDRVARSVPVERVDSPYAVAPGTLTTTSGGAYKVFGPYLRAWLEHGWERAQAAPADPQWVRHVRSEALPSGTPTEAGIPPGGERAAHARLDAFLDGLAGYAVARDRPDLDVTSRLSPYLRFGCLHPRQVLGELGSGADADKLRSELAWRDFYADTLADRPETAWRNARPDLDGLAWDAGEEADRRFSAWALGRTGVPIVDAGMRQLRAEGWMHNRVRMVVASFLVKDLHLDWRRGARHFLDHLVDGDLASNNLGWQWVAGTGADASPFFRIFNPTRQAARFDPEGDYVRRWVPELRAVPGGAVHEPWKLAGGPPSGYLPPIVDHSEERAVALARYAARTGTR